ncbi:MAG: helix-turn-helix domain-containing protein [Candidatus Methylomirabilia bacterium]
MPDLCLNIRFLLWKKGVVRAGWVAKLEALLGWTEEAAERFLTGETGALGDKDLKALARFGGVADGDLTAKDLLATANLDLFHENLSFLIDLLPHGEKKRFAERLGVDATTISRWKNGAQKPTKRKLAAILRYFGLPNETDLASAAVFLSSGPIGTAELREWLHGQIERLEGDLLLGLYPALSRLLSRR